MSVRCFQNGLRHDPSHAAVKIPGVVSKELVHAVREEVELVRFGIEIEPIVVGGDVTVPMIHKKLQSEVAAERQRVQDSFERFDGAFL